MAHELDFSNNRANIAYAGAEPWHGLGQRIDPDRSLEEWREAAGLNWDALRAPVQFKAQTGNILAPEKMVEAPQEVIYRSDTLAPLGVVSKSYREVQPSVVLEFFRRYVEHSGPFRMHTVGALKGGKIIWALARAEDDLISLGDDKIARFLLLATSFDKTMATVVQQTSIRVVCNNTLTAAYYNGQNRVDPVLRFSHHAVFTPEVARTAMAFDDQWAAFTQSVEKWARRKVTRRERNTYFRNVFELPSVDPAATAKVRAQQKRLEELEHARTTSPGAELESARDTVWGLVNAVTWTLDHETGRSADNRLSQAWFGQRKYIKRRAIEEAERLVA